MSVRYLFKYAENAKLALDLAQKEIKHLTYTRQTLFNSSIDLLWVESLAEFEDLSEKIDAFVSPFIRLQDHNGEKLIPRFAALLAIIIFKFEPKVRICIRAIGSPFGL